MTTTKTTFTSLKAGCHLRLLVPVVSVVFQKPQAKTASKKTSSTSLKRQPAFRLVKVVFVVVHRQHRVHNQTVVPVVSVVVKREGGSLEGYTKRSGRNPGRSPGVICYWENCL